MNRTSRYIKAARPIHVQVSHIVEMNLMARVVLHTDDTVAGCVVGDYSA